MDWARTSRGYGHIGVRGKNYKVSRLIYSLCIGELPASLLICHHCDNPPCCRPDHLFAGSQSDNMRDAFLKGRSVPQPQRGEKNPNTHLTADVVREIRLRTAQTKGTPGWQKALASEFRLSTKGIRRILSREVWGHVE